MAEIIPERDPQALDLAVRLLKSGELVAYPTDTVYGLGALASDDAAVKRLFVAKGRAPSKAMPLLVADDKMASWVGDLTPVAHQLMSAFWPGPLTIVMRRQGSFRSLALGGGDTVALRAPDSHFAWQVIRALGEPIVGTSANKSGSREPSSAAEAAFQLGELVALVVDGGRVAGTASTVIDITREGGPTIVRPGAVKAEEIERVLRTGPGPGQSKEEAGKAKEEMGNG
ncbi:MAG: L-threonylcarbamoyladenylate synthase [Dehalococcoidia bacterium]